MQQIIVDVTVDSFDTFLTTFRDRGQALRGRHGSAGVRVFRHTDEPARVTLLFEWSSADAFRGFLADPEVQATMRSGGTVGPPRVTFVDAPLALPA